MPLPLILGIAAAVAAVTGVGVGVRGGMKMKDANDTISEANDRHEKNIKLFKKSHNSTIELMDKVGKKELEVFNSFSRFQDAFEKIHNRPEIDEYYADNYQGSKYEPKKIKEVAVGAGVLLGGLGGAAVGTAGGFAAAGATTAAVMALGTASTGTAIATLSGAALTNATLAALGGGALAAGGGGIALGTTILGASTLGIGLLVGGIVFSITGSTLSDKADKAFEQMKQAEKEINTVVNFQNRLKSNVTKFLASFEITSKKYYEHLNLLEEVVSKKQNYFEYDSEERKIVENTVLLVGLLYKMGKVQLVQKGNNENDVGKVNSYEINKVIIDSTQVIESI